MSKAGGLLSFYTSSRKWRTLCHCLIILPIVMMWTCFVYNKCYQFVWKGSDSPQMVPENSLVNLPEDKALEFKPAHVEATAAILPTAPKEVEQVNANMLESGAAKKAELVHVALYYETLCPDCRHFITKMLYPSFQKVNSLMNLTLVPYGHADEKRVGDQWLFTCQHGPAECEGNTIHACAIDIVKDIHKYMPFVYCMETKYGQVVTAARQCGEEHKLPIEDILACSMSLKGNALEHKMAVMTETLEPKLTWVPWITLEGVHNKDIQRLAERDFVKLICDAYKGSKPAECDGH